MKGREIPVENYNKIVDILTFCAKRYPDRIAMRMRKENVFYEVTYSELLENVKKIAGYLKSKRFKKGERAAVLGENRPEWGMCHLGILWAGGIVVPLDSRATSSEWAHIMRHSESKFLFVSSRFYDEIVEVKDDIPELKEIISFDSENPEPNLPFIFSEIKEMDKPEELKRDDVALILYTSGTTGLPKGIMLTHDNILSNIEMMLKVLDVDENDVFFSILPIHHVFEGTCGFLAPLTIGCEIFYARSLKSKELLEDLKTARPTIFLVVPLLLEKLLMGINKNVRKANIIKKGMFYSLKGLSKMFQLTGNKRVSHLLFKKVRSELGLDRLKYLISGGAALPRWISREYELMGFPIYQGYGLSETSPVVSVNLPGKCKNESVGPPLPGVEVKIFDPDPEGVGEIGVKGKIVMKGYYKNEEATKKVFRGEWFLTGDMGKVDKDGFLYITGRKKSVIVTKGGKNIYPEEIEEKLLQSPFIKEVLVLARIHPKTKVEEIHAIIYPDFEFLDEWSKEKEIEITDEKLNKIMEEEIEKINKELADYKRVRSFSIREEEFPKTTTQKIKRYLFEQGGIEIT
ncbi:MAG: AMP-binding protein [candidate division WOR-3 bacterium]